MIEELGKKHMTPRAERKEGAWPVLQRRSDRYARLDILLGQNARSCDSPKFPPAHSALNTNTPAEAVSMSNSTKQYGLERHRALLLTN